MKILFRLLPFVLAAAFANPAHAALNPKDVSADASWVAYIDFNGLRETALGRELIDAIKKSPPGKDRGPFDVNYQKVLATIGSVTAYGSKFTTEPRTMDGVMVIRGSADFRKIAEALVLEVNVAHPQRAVEIKDLSVTAYALKGDHNTVDEAVTVAFPPEPVVIVSKSRAQVVQALAVIRGSAASLVQHDTSAISRFLPGSAGAHVFIASVVPSEALNDVDADMPKARIFKMAKAVSLAIGERGPNTTAHVELLANSDDSAEKLTKIVQGITAMVSLTESNDNQLADFVNSASVKRDGESVTLDLAYPSERLAGMLHHAIEVRREQNTAPTAPASGPIVAGRLLDQWDAPVAAGNASADATDTHTIENVVLKNGALLTFGRQVRPKLSKESAPDDAAMNAAQMNRALRRHIRRVEITPAAGGSPLVFRFERATPPNLEFPGVDGTYSVKLTYDRAASAQITYGVGVIDPRPDNSDTPPSSK